jgi:hypothetical protein
MKKLTRLVITLCCAGALAASAGADGFSLDYKLSHDPHFFLELTDAQIETVGVWRRLDLTREQLAILRQQGVKSPKTLGVETAGEPDCSCCISSAFWFDKNHVVIWTDRLHTDKDGSAGYYKMRMEDSRYVFDANGNLFHQGKPVPIADFLKMVTRPPAGAKQLQLSLSPGVSPALEAKLRKLQGKYCAFSCRF